MHKDAIVQLLEEKHVTLLDWLEKQDKDHWESGPDNKWTTGQVALHLLQSIKPLNDAMSMPKFFLNYKFGKANREVWQYDAVVNRYYEKLKEVSGVVSPYSRNMKVVPYSDKKYIITRIQMENKKLQYKTKKWTDKDLDTYILPHPLMGKMPVRELIMWTAYHTEHHSNQLISNY